MKIIVGLGNPGREYDNTRHNVGFSFVDAFAKCKEITPLRGLSFGFDKKFKADIAKTSANGEKIILVKPITFMNSSGESVANVLKYFKVKTEDLIVIFDDIDLPLGILRIKNRGSSGGHKGVQSIIDEIGSEKFIHFRIGVSENEKVGKAQTVDFVLSRFSKREKELVDRVIELGVNYLVEFVGKKQPMPNHTLEIAKNTQKG